MTISTYYRQKIRSIKDFDYTLNYKELNLRAHPELYRVGRGEQWVLMIEPYKSEILPYWRFKTPEIAQESAAKIYEMFLEYLDADDFVGADMARKFLQMWYTRSRRYANHASGRKYRSNPQMANNQQEESKLKADQLPQESDALSNTKAESARIFYWYYLQAKTNQEYVKRKKQFVANYKDINTTTI